MKLRGLLQYSLSLRRLICLSIISQMIIRAIAFSFILFAPSSKMSRNRAVAILKIKVLILLLVLQFYNHLAQGVYSINLPLFVQLSINLNL